MPTKVFLAAVVFRKTVRVKSIRGSRATIVMENIPAASNGLL